MKTPIQELIEQLKEEKDLHGYDRGFIYEEVIELAESMLEKEKELIIKTYNHAALHGTLVELGNTEIINAEEFYNKTFNTKEK